MKASSILDDYISSFESSFMRSNKKSRAAQKENQQPFANSQVTRDKSFERYLSTSTAAAAPYNNFNSGSVNVSQIAPSKLADLCYDSDDKLISSLLNGNRDTRLTLDDIPTRENEGSASGLINLQQIKQVGLNQSKMSLDKSQNSNSSSILNFKDFYEQSKLDIKSTKNQGYQSKFKSSNLGQEEKLGGGLRSKSTGVDRDVFKNKLHSNLNMNLKPSLVKYDINEFLPKDNQTTSSRLSASILAGQSLLSSNLPSRIEQFERGLSRHQSSSQQAAMDLFSSNLLQNQKASLISVPRLNERALSQNQNLRLSQLDHSPILEKAMGHNFLNQQPQPFMPSQTQSSVCSCVQLPHPGSLGVLQSQLASQQMLLTQRSSCSCQFSNSSGGHSHIASPLSTNQKAHNPGHFHRPSLQGMTTQPNIFQYAPQQVAQNNQQQLLGNLHLGNNRQISHSYQSSIANVNLNSQFNKATSQPNLLPLGTPIPSQSNYTQRDSNQEPLSEIQGDQRAISNSFAQNQATLNLISSNQTSPLNPQLHKELIQKSLPQNIHSLNIQNHKNDHLVQNPLSTSSFIFKDRSTTFMRGTDEKGSATGYNTDDLLRDSESEVDLNQVSQIIQSVNDKFMNGFQNYLKISQAMAIPSQQESQQLNQVEVSQTAPYQQQQQVQQAFDRAQKELLAMQILQQNASPYNQQQRDWHQAKGSDLNLSQIQTIKPNQILRPVSQISSQASHHMQNSNNTLMLDSLQTSNLQLPQGISMIQTPQSLLMNISKQSESSQMKPSSQQKNLIEGLITQKPSQFQNENLSGMTTQEQQMLFQQAGMLMYQSPHFNQAEDPASLIQFFSNKSNQSQIPQLTMMNQPPNFQENLPTMDDPNQLTLKNIQIAKQSSDQSLKSQNQVPSYQCNSQFQDQSQSSQKIFAGKERRSDLKNQQQKSQEKAKDKKAKRKKSKTAKNAEIARKLAKKNYNEEEYSNRKHYQDEGRETEDDEAQDMSIMDKSRSQERTRVISQNSSQYHEYEPSLNYISQLNQSGLAQLEQLSHNLNCNLDLAQMQQLLFIHSQNARNQQHLSEVYSSQQNSGSTSSSNTHQFDSAKINTTASAESLKASAAKNNVQEYLTNQNARDYIMMGSDQAQSYLPQTNPLSNNPYLQIMSSQNLQSRDESSIISSDEDSKVDSLPQSAQNNWPYFQQFPEGQNYQSYYQQLMRQMNQDSDRNQISGQGALMIKEQEQDDEGLIIEKYQSANKNDQSLMNVLSEMNLSVQQQNSSNQIHQTQDLQSDVNLSRGRSRARNETATEASFLDKSELQFLEQSKLQRGSNQSKIEENTQENNKEKINHRRIPQLNLDQQVKSSNYSNANSKSSSVVGQDMNAQIPSQNHVFLAGQDNLILEEKKKEYQNHPSTNSTGRDSKKNLLPPIITQGKNMVLQHNASAHHFSQPSNLLSPYGPNGLQSSSHFNNYDHFKSQCSEVIIRGSSETDISNRIQAMKQFSRARDGSNGGREGANQSEISSSHHFQSQNNLHSQHNQHSHQISGCQSIVNLGEPPMHTRSQFTSIDSHATYSPTKAINRRQSQPDQQNFNSNLVQPNIPKSNQHQQRNFSYNPKLDQISQLKLQQSKLNQISQMQDQSDFKVLPIRDDVHIDSSYDPNDRFFDDKITEQQLMAGDTFMKDTQKKALEFNSTGQSKQVNSFIQNYHRAGQEKGIFSKDIQSQQQVLYTTQENYQSLETDGGHQQEIRDMQTNGSAQQQTENDFNYTIRLDELNQQQKSQSNSYAQRPPIYQPATNHQSLPAHNQMPHYQAQMNQYMNGTGSTAGFPQIYGYMPSQQSGRKSSVNSSFHSQNIKHSDSQSTLPIQSMQSQRSMIVKARIKKLSFMEKVNLIQKKVKEFLAKKRLRSQKHDSMQICNTRDLHRMMEGSGIGDEEIQKLVAHHDLNFEPHALGFFGDSTIQKPHDDSLSNISAQLLNSLKHDLGGSNLKQIKPSDQSYQRNILESLNLTTGNTFIKDTRHFKQGALRERTQNFGNSSALVLYSGSTQDNRGNPFQRNSVARQSDGNNLESQGSFQKPPLYEHQDYLILNKESTAEAIQMAENLQQQMSPNTSGLLNMTDESNSGIFKLTPHASQNVTQKTGHTQGIYNQTNSHMNATESNNLNYSCSEVDSEWYNHVQNSGKQSLGGAIGNVGIGSVSPLSVNTTSSKIKNVNGAKMGQRIPTSKMLLQENNLYGASVGAQTPSENQNLIFNQRSASIQSEQILQPHSLIQRQQSKIRIEENFLQSPISSLHSSQQQMKMNANQDPQLPQQESSLTTNDFEKESKEKLMSIMKSSQDYDSNRQTYQTKVSEKYPDQSKTSNSKVSLMNESRIQDGKGGNGQGQWKLLQPMRMQEFNNMIKSIFLQSQYDSNFKSVQSQSSQNMKQERSESKMNNHSYQKQLIAMEL